MLTATLAVLGARDQEPQYYTVTMHDHEVLDQMGPYADVVVDKGRIQIFELRPGISLSMLPAGVRSALKPIDLDVLSVTPVSPILHQVKQRLGLSKRDPRIEAMTEQVTAESFENTVTEVVEHGTRTTNASITWMMDRLRQYGYEPTHNYNIETWKQGTVHPEEVVIIVGHMDTVANTVGADDNASGASGVLEAARVFADVETERSILFLITEDEEEGLLGARRYVRQLREQGKLASVKFVVNMDMIAHNANGIVDLETEPVFEALTDWMADVAMTYTTLRPNKVLNAWGSDHVPFIEAGVPTLLTIEHWNTHTPCWHRSCDTLSTLNFAYGKEIVRLNIAALALKAGLVD